MIERRREGNELREEFNVLGSTGNVKQVHGPSSISFSNSFSSQVYTVAIDHLPTCNCRFLFSRSTQRLRITIVQAQTPKRATTAST